MSLSLSPLALLGHRPASATRVAHLVQRLQPGALASLIGAACAGLSSRQMPCCCLDLDGSRPGADPRLLAGALLSLDLAGRPAARRILALAAALRRLRVDILHTHGGVYGEGAAAALLARVPLLVHDDLGGSDGVPARRLLQAGRLLPTRFLASSRQAARALGERAGIAADRIGRLPWVVDAERFRPGLDREPTRRRLGVADGEIVVGSVGALSAERNYGALLEAVTAIHGEGGEVRCLLVGDGPQRDALGAQARQLGIADRVHLVGSSGEVPLLLAAMDIFVLPSRSPAVPQSLLEALAAGLPVVAGSGGPVAEVVGDGENGLLVPPDNPRILARILGQLGASASHRTALATRARAAALQHTPQLAVEELARVYREIVSPTF